MHLPVLIAGFLLPWQYSALVGIATPLLSSFITGMPPLPTVFTMTAELFTYGITTSLLYRNFKKNTYVSMISAMLIGRLVSILAKLDSFQLCSWATIQANSFSLQHVRNRSTWNCYSNTYHSSLGNTISA